MLQPPIAMLCDVNKVCICVSVHGCVCLINSAFLNRMTFLGNRLLTEEPQIAKARAILWLRQVSSLS